MMCSQSKAQISCTCFFDHCGTCHTNYTSRQIDFFENYFYICDTLRVKMPFTRWHYDISFSVALICCSMVTYLTVWQHIFIVLPPCLLSLQIFPVSRTTLRSGQMTRSTAALYQCPAQKVTWTVVSKQDAVKQYAILKCFVFKIHIYLEFITL